MDVSSPALDPTKVGPELPLDGILVVSLEQAVAGPYATRQLADLGARVIKVERPGRGDFARDYDGTVRGLSSHFVWVNRSKESLVLDLKSQAGKAALQGLVGRADVLLSNLRPGALARLGFEPSELRVAHPRLVVCTITGFGPRGPYRDRRAYDLLVQCEAALLAVTGTPEAPAKVGIPVADIAAATHAFAGILAALYRRERTGQGAHVEVSLLDSLAEWMGYPLYYTAYGGEPPTRSGSHHAAIAPYGPFRARDGAVVFLAVQNQGEWERLCSRVLQMTELARDPRFASNSDRAANSTSLQAIIESCFASWSGPEVEEKLEAAGVASARLRSVEELLEHPQLRARRRWQTVQSPAGELFALTPPIGIDGTPTRMGPVPALGEHTSAILAELESPVPRRSPE